MSLTADEVRWVAHLARLRLTDAELETMTRQLRSIVAWSRILADHEILAAINTDPDNPRTAWVTIDHSLHNEGDTLGCLYSTDPAAIGTTVAVARRNGNDVQLTLPAAGFVLYH